MSTERPLKEGNVRTYQEKVGLGYVDILASEMDADLDTIYAAWNVGAAGGPAGGHLSGSYPDPSIAPGVILNAHVNDAANIAGSKLLAKSVDGLRLTKPIAARALRTTPFPIPNGTSTPIPFDQAAPALAAYPTSPGVAWSAGAPTRLTVTEAGVYLVSIFALLANSGAAAPAHAQLLHGGAIVAGNSPYIAAGGFAYVAASMMQAATVNEYFTFEVLAYTANISVDTSFTRPASIAAVRVG